jgi:hypothetical protein
MKFKKKKIYHDEFRNVNDNELKPSDKIQTTISSFPKRPGAAGQQCPINEPYPILFILATAAPPISTVVDSQRSINEKLLRL